MWGDSGVQIFGVEGARALILILHECIRNAASLALPAFDDTGSLGFHPSCFMVPPWVTASRFLVGNREAELKLTTFS